MVHTLSSTPVHMSGAGNTFLVMTPDAVPDLTPHTSRTMVPALLDSHPRVDGAPIEGLLIVTPGDHFFACDFYNPDGSHGMVCGNGARCAVRFAVDHGTQPVDGNIQFTLNGNAYTATIPASSEPPAIISIRLPAPTQEQQYAAGSLRGVDVDVYYVFVPSDHAVIDMPSGNMRAIVQAIRHHEVFPRGVNVNMVEVEAGGTVNIATFERGVEAITGACGTGAVASAIALWRSGRVSDTVVVRPPSGRLLTVIIHHTGTTIEGVDLRGDAQYDGTPE